MKHIPLHIIRPNFTQTGVNVDAILRKFPTMQYVGQFSLKTKTDRTDFPVDVFYTPSPDADRGHTHYAAFYVQDKKVMVTDGSSVTGIALTGAYCDDGTVIYPRCQHDYREFNDGADFCDGGGWVRSDTPSINGKYAMHTRWGGRLDGKSMLTLVVIDGKLYDIGEHDVIC